MVNRLVVVGVLLLVCLVGSVPVRAADPPPHQAVCQPGYHYVESQTWWTLAGSGGRGGNGHGHLGACWPLTTPVSGLVSLDLHTTMFEDPGTWEILQLSIPKAPHSGPEIVASIKQRRACPTPTDGSMWICHWHDTLTFDSRAFTYDGWHLLRARLKIAQPNGLEERVTIYLRINVRNGKPVRDTVKPGEDRFQQWYTEPAGYIATRFVDDPGSLVAAPKRGLWTVRLTADSDAVSSEVLIDPNIHGGDRGIVVYDGPRLNGSVTIDTTRLTNGPHRLFFRAMKPAKNPDGTPIEYSSVSLITFTVENE